MVKKIILKVKEGDPAEFGNWHDGKLKLKVVADNQTLRDISNAIKSILEKTK